MTEEEQSAMIQKYRHLIASCARSVHSDAEEDDDAMQCGMIGLWEACQRWDGVHAFVPFAIKCIRCNIIDYYRSKREEDPLDENTPYEEQPPNRQEDVERIMQAARKVLKKRSREMAVLKSLLAGKKKEAIAKRLCISKRTVHRISVRAWMLVKEELGRE